MKPFLLTAYLIIFGHNLQLITQNSLIADTKVFICKSPNATVYHPKKDCWGLNKCTHKILEVTEDEAGVSSL